MVFEELKHQCGGEAFAAGTLQIGLNGKQREQLEVGRELRRKARSSLRLDAG